jgi:hypothetical protein
MLKFVCVASAFLALSSTVSEARPSRVFSQASGCNVTMPCDFSISKTGRNQVVYNAQSPQRLERLSHSPRGRVEFGHREVSRADVAGAQIVSGRPSGCPRSFCGCGAALRVFGRIVPELNLAANWLRFPRTSPASGMVAARHGHVFVLEQHVEGDTWMAYDANSGGHATRIHARSLRGYTVVNPHAA